MHVIHALISDLDDTLLTAEHTLSPRTVRTLQRIQRQGVKVILASGRAAASMRPYVETVGTPWPYIACNGAQIVDAHSGEVLASSELPVALAREMLAWLKARDVYAQLYEEDDWCYDKPCRYADDYCRSSGVIGRRVDDLAAYIQRPTAKLLAVDEPERIRALIAEASDAFRGRLSVATSKPYFMEVTSLEATKGNAVKKLAAMLGLTPETTICAGDSLNDLSMLSWSQLPVSVSNARDAVKAVAWRVAGNGQQDGIAELLDELIPEGYTC